MNLQSDQQVGRFPPGNPCAYAIAELLAFPYGETIDIIDAQSYTKEMLYRPETTTEMQRGFYKKRAEERGITGYGDW